MLVQVPLMCLMIRQPYFCTHIILMVMDYMDYILKAMTGVHPVHPVHRNQYPAYFQKICNL